MANDYVNIQIESDYQYIHKGSDSIFDIAHFLEYKAMFEGMEWTKTELDHISKQLVVAGKTFAKNQG